MYFADSDMAMKSVPPPHALLLSTRLTVSYTHLGGVGGDIHEEYEEEEPELTELEPHKVYRVSGGITLFDLKEEMHLHMDSSCDTLSGYLMEQLGYIPSREQLPLTVVTPEADYEILEMEDRVIEWVKLTLKETKKEQEE